MRLPGWRKRLSARLVRIAYCVDTDLLNPTDDYMDHVSVSQRENAKRRDLHGLLLHYRSSIMSSSDLLLGEENASYALGLTSR